MLTLSLQTLSVVYLFFSLTGTPRAYFIWALCCNLVMLASVVPLFDLAMRLKCPRFMMILWLCAQPVSAYFFARAGQGLLLADLIPATLSFALFCSGYWTIRHWWFALSGTSAVVGRQVAGLWIVRIVTAALGGLLTGYIATLFGVSRVFQASFISAVLAAIPLFFLRLPSGAELLRRQPLKEVLKFAPARRLRLAYFLEGVTEIGMLSMWSLLLLAVLPNIKVVGFVVAVGALSSALLSRLMGSAFDNKNRDAPLTFAVFMRVLAGALGFLAVLRPVTWVIMLVDSFGRLANSFLYTSLDSYLYAFSRDSDPARFILYREVLLNFGRCLTCALCVIVLPTLNVNSMGLIMVMGALSNLVWLRLRRVGAEIAARR